MREGVFGAMRSRGDARPDLLCCMPQRQIPSGSRSVSYAEHLRRSRLVAAAQLERTDETFPLVVLRR